MSKKGSAHALLIYDEMASKLSREVLELTQTNDPNNELPARQAELAAAMFTRGYLEVLYDSFDKIRTLPAHWFACIYQEALRWPEHLRFKCAKFALAYPFARYNRQELPLNPCDVKPLFTGRVKRFLKNRLVSHNQRSLKFFWGLFQGVKRSCAPANPSDVLASFDKHAETLSKPDSGTVDDDHEEKYESVFSKFYNHRPEMMEPSPGACYNILPGDGFPSCGTRASGGNRGAIRRIHSRYVAHGSIVTPELAYAYEVRPGVVQWCYDLFPDTEISEWERRALEEPPIVQVHPILEPLKVRIITKGPTITQTYCRRLQKDLWNFLKKTEQFRLIGEPISVEPLWWLRKQTRSMGLDFKGFVSGDYSSATDSISFQHTRAVIEEVLRRPYRVETPGVSFRESPLSEVTKTIYRNGLALSEVHYPRLENQKFPRPAVHQRTGQLMGSVLSFPVLCVINLVGYWRSIERATGKTWAWEDLPVLINGDDILFMADQNLYDIWKEEVQALGLSLSVGKNYYSEEICTINSELFTWSNQDGFRHVPYFNAGLLTGLTKVTGRQTARDAPIQDYYNLVMEGATNRARAHRRFLHYHKQEIQRLTDRGKFNLFSPPTLGGLGFRAWPNGPVPEFTIFQRRLARQLIDRGEGGFEGPDAPLALCGTGRSAVILPWKSPRKVLVPETLPVRTEDVIPKTQPFGWSTREDPERDVYYVEDQYWSDIHRRSGRFPKPLGLEKIMNFELVVRPLWTIG
jgi:hypothetical protein